jgi:pyridoxal phosphate enzyme (YggS family)
MASRQLSPDGDLMIVERLQENLAMVRGRIAAAAQRSGRAPEAVRLVAVTKKRPTEWVRALVGLGVADLGENYPQELWAKADALADLPVRWHLIGHLQGNKARRTVPLVRVIHSVDSLKLLRSLDTLAGGLTDPPEVLIQVNTSEEASKHGWSPDALRDDADALATCRRVTVRGLMTMAALDSTPEQARSSFASLRQLRDDLRGQTGLPLDELSMGMSNDYEVAIEEGATIVRVGTALFEGLAT